VLNAPDSGVDITESPMRSLFVLLASLLLLNACSLDTGTTDSQPRRGHYASGPSNTEYHYYYPYGRADYPQDRIYVVQPQQPCGGYAYRGYCYRQSDDYYRAMDYDRKKGYDDGWYRRQKDYCSNHDCRRHDSDRNGHDNNGRNNNKDHKKYRYDNDGRESDGRRDDQQDRRRYDNGSHNGYQQRDDRAKRHDDSRYTSTPGVISAPESRSDGYRRQEAGHQTDGYRRSDVYRQSDDAQTVRGEGQSMDSGQKRGHEQHDRDGGATLDPKPVPYDAPAHHGNDVVSDSSPEPEYGRSGDASDRRRSRSDQGGQRESRESVSASPPQFEVPVMREPEPSYAPPPQQEAPVMREPEPSYEPPPQQEAPVMREPEPSYEPPPQQEAPVMREPEPAYEPPPRREERPRQEEEVQSAPPPLTEAPPVEPPAVDTVP
jgi:hypothetical protein